MIHEGHEVHEGWNREEHKDREYWLYHSRAFVDTSVI